MASCPGQEKYGYEDTRFEREIDDNFHCSVCYNVLKEPMMCRNNEHIFCRACITEHLNVNRQTCPECNEKLTVQTLRRAPRVVINYLSTLKINCDYSERGCKEFIQLEKLEAHVQECGFAPVNCSNVECKMVIDKQEVVHHESICEHRKAKCHSCTKLEKEIAEMKENMEKLAGKEDVNRFKEDVKLLMVQMFEKLSSLENSIQIASVVNHASNSSLEDIFVAGGMNNYGDVGVKSTERFSWKNYAWERLSLMNTGRSGAISFVNKNELFVASGCDNTIEVANLNEDLLQWRVVANILPHDCARTRCVFYQSRMILFCACGTGECYELSLIAPYMYTCKLFCEIPEPTRQSFQVVAFERKVLIFGGKTIGAHSIFLDSVLEFDLDTKKFTAMPPLCHARVSMAAVRWGDQAVLIGGCDKNGYSNNVCLYNSKMGTTTLLPSMVEERAGCAAVITGNVIVVMGGRGKNGRVKSVEAFTFGGYSWKHLPDMNEFRSAATATVLPRENN